MNLRETLKIEQQALSIGGISVDKLAKEYGTPLYVMDQSHIENMCKTFVDGLKSNNVDGMICYASKAFCSKYIYNLINQYGLGADVVSSGELFTALKSDFPADKIIFHGNNKLPEEIYFALENDIKYFVIDSERELDLLQEKCKKLNKIQQVLIRVNPGVEAHTHHYIQTAKTDSKFGFSIDNGDATDFIQKVLKCSNVKLVGLHCHIGSQIFESVSFKIAVEKMCKYYAFLKQSFGVEFPV